jgi:transcriptional regulator with XRE-family HTH domain
MQYNLDPVRFGELLKQALQEKGMTQIGLARIIGVSGNSIFAYVSGKNFPSLDVFAKIVVALNFSADYLLGLSGPKDLKQEYDELREDLLIMRTSYASMPEKKRKAFLQYVRSIAEEDNNK